MSCTGVSKKRYMKIDSCIALLVKALQKGNIDMRGCCCGHNKSFGDIHLQDGRILIILDSNWYYKKGNGFLRKCIRDTKIIVILEN